MSTIFPSFISGDLRWPMIPPPLPKKKHSHRELNLVHLGTKFNIELSCLQAEAPIKRSHDTQWFIWLSATWWNARQSNTVAKSDIFSAESHDHKSSAEHLVKTNIYNNVSCLITSRMLCVYKMFRFVSPFRLTRIGQCCDFSSLYVYGKIQRHAVVAGN